MSHFHRAAPAAFALCAALAIGTTAAAAQVAVSGDADQVIRKVAYSDADLHTVDGARSLAQRVRVAADYVCGGDSILIRRGANFERCRHAAIDRAIADLNAPMVMDALGRSVSALAKR